MIRRFVSLSLVFSFLLLAASSIMLYVVPEGRVAYWSHWSALSFSKEQWGAMHITGGFMFLLFSFWHICLNLRPLKNYILNRRGLMPLVCAVFACLLCYVATLENWQPMRFVLELNQSIKADQERRHGAPPYGHAEKSSFSSFCSFLRLDENRVLEGLRQQGLSGVDAGRTLEDVAADNGMSPAMLYRHILDIPGVEPSAAGQGSGRGRRTNLQ